MTDVDKTNELNLDIGRKSALGAQDLVLSMDKRESISRRKKLSSTLMETHSKKDEDAIISKRIKEIMRDEPSFLSDNRKQIDESLSIRKEEKRIERRKFTPPDKRIVDISQSVSNDMNSSMMIAVKSTNRIQEVPPDVISKAMKLKLIVI